MAVIKYDPDLAPLTANDVFEMRLQAEHDTVPLTAADAEARDLMFKTRIKVVTEQVLMERFLRDVVLAGAPWGSRF